MNLSERVPLAPFGRAVTAGSARWRRVADDATTGGALAAGWITTPVHATFVRETQSDNGLSDEALVERIRASPTDDLRDFETLVDRHRTRVIANCRHLTRQPNEAEDLAQEVFVKAYFGFRRFRGDSLFQTWLQRITMNHCFDYLKRRKGRNCVDVEALVAGDVAVSATAERDLLRLEARDRLAAVLDAMPARVRIPLVLRDLDGLAYHEISEIWASVCPRSRCASCGAASSCVRVSRRRLPGRDAQMERARCGPRMHHGIAKGSRGLRRHRSTIDKNLALKAKPSRPRRTSAAKPIA